MERTDKQENNRRRRGPPRILGGLPVAMSAAGADGLLICGRNAFDVPEGRGPGYPVPIGLDDVGLTDLDATIDICAIESRTATSVVVFYYVSGSRRVNAIFVVTSSFLYGLLAADCDDFGVSASLCHRSGAASNAKEDYGD